MNGVNPTRNDTCLEYIKALEDCHASGYLARYTGKCNSVKKEMVMCLKAERIARANNNRAEAKVRRAKTAQAFADLEREKNEP